MAIDTIAMVQWRSQAEGAKGAIASPIGYIFYIVLKYLNLNMEIVLKILLIHYLLLVV